MVLLRVVGYLLATIGYGLRGLVRALVGGGRVLTLLKGRSSGGDAGSSRWGDLLATARGGDVLAGIGLIMLLATPAQLTQARQQLALLLPAAAVVVAAVLPFLHRLGRSRRYATAALLLARGVLAWMVAGHLPPLARHAAIAGLFALCLLTVAARPPGREPLRASASVHAASLLGGLLAAPVGFVAGWAGPAWPIRFAAVAYLVAAGLAVSLPAAAPADPAATAGFGAADAVVGAARPTVPGGGAGVRPLWPTLTVAAALRAMLSMLAVALTAAIAAGTLTSAGGSETALLALIAVAMTVGAGLGTGARLGTRAESTALATVVLAGLAAIAAAIYPVAAMAALLALVLAAAAALGRSATVGALTARATPGSPLVAAFSTTVAAVAGAIAGLAPLPLPGLLAGVAAIGLIATGVAGTGLVRQRRRDRAAGATAPLDETTPDHQPPPTAPPMPSASRPVAPRPAPNQPPSPRPAPPGYHLYRPSTPTDSPPEEPT